MALSVFYSKANLFINHTIILRLKSKLYNCYVLPVLLYSCEIWAVTPQDVQRLQAFQNIYFRTILGIRYPKRISNEDLWTILSKVNVTPISVTVPGIILRWTGHVLRMQPNRIPQQIMFSNLHSGSRNRGRAPHRIVTVLISTCASTEI